MEQSFLPDGSYDLEVSLASNATDVLRSFSSHNQSLWMIPVENILVKDGFNVRIHNDEYEAHIENIKQSIIEEGFHSHEPIGVFVDDTQEGPLIYVHSGHTRLAATKRAINEGCPITAIPCVPLPKGTNREDITLSLISSNQGKPLSPLERAAVIKMTHRYGLKEGEIAKRTGMDLKTVKFALTIMETPIEMREMIAAGKITYTGALSLIEEYGHAVGLKKAKAMLARATNEGKQKVSMAMDHRLKAKRDLIKFAPKMLQTMADVQMDPGFDNLMPETRSIIAEILGAVSASSSGSSLAQ